MNIFLFDYLRYIFSAEKKNIYICFFPKHHLLPVRETSRSWFDNQHLYFYFKNRGGMDKKWDCRVSGNSQHPAIDTLQRNSIFHVNEKRSADSNAASLKHSLSKLEFLKSCVWEKKKIKKSWFLFYSHWGHVISSSGITIKSIHYVSLKAASGERSKNERKWKLTDFITFGVSPKDLKLI